jgi:predicted transcriptional regulator
MFVRELMSTCVAECTEDTPLEQVYEAMQNCGHHVVVVLESKYHRIPIGLVTEHTILEQLVARGRNPHGLRAANVMTSKIAKVTGGTSVASCPAASELDHGTPIVVVDENRNVCGLLSKEVLRLAQVDQIRQRRSTQVNPAVDHSPLLGWTQ